MKFADQDHPLWNAVQRRALGELRALGGTVDLDVRFTCDGGYTALERATAGKPDVDLIDALLEAGASPNARGLCSPLERLVVSNGREPLVVEHEAKIRPLVQYALASLQKAGVDFGARSPTGTTSIMRGQTYYRSYVVSALLDCGVPLDARDEYGSTALLDCVRATGEFDTVECLLDRKPDTLARIWSGADHSAFHSAFLVGKRASSFASRLRDDLAARLRELESNQAPRPEPAVHGITPSQVSAIVAALPAGAQLDHLNMHGEALHDIHSSLFVYPLDWFALNDEDRERYRGALKGYGREFIPIAFLTGPMPKRTKTRPVSSYREIGPRTVAGVLSLDVTPKPDTRRPVYFARTGVGGGLGQRERVAQTPAELNLRC